MSDEIEKDDNNILLRYRVKKLEELMESVLSTVGALDKKVGLLAQKLMIATAIIGVIFQGMGVWYSVHGSKAPEYSEQDKQKYYETRISDSDKVKQLEKELYELRNKK